MKQLLKNEARAGKHFLGWRSPQCYVAFAVDDYGSIRTANAAARDYQQKQAPTFCGQMDELIAVQTIQVVCLPFDFQSWRARRL